MATSSDGLSPEEVGRLEQDLPKLADFGPAMLVPFVGYKLSSARVAWINDRWFLERGFDTGDPVVSRKICSWLIDEFAYVSACGTSALPKGTGGAARILYADRYGSTDGMSPHGGSGRVATMGSFQAKGIGVTPLVGEAATHGHAHGCCSVAEAMREAIYAELAFQEFPHGAIPTIGIIDTGLFYTSQNTRELFDLEVRRGISIRPAVLRLAHMERAPMFHRGKCGFLNIQAADSQRARAVVTRFNPGNGQPPPFDRLPGLRELLQRVVKQIAFGQAHRFFNGGFFSSNISVCGALLDFGNAHLMRDWSRARVLPHAPGFGDEMLTIARLAQSLCFFSDKYCGRPIHHGKHLEMFRKLANVHAQERRSEWRRIWGLPEASCQLNSTLIELTEARFQSEQQRKVTYELGEGSPASKETSHSASMYEDILRASNFGIGGQFDTWQRMPTSIRMSVAGRCLDVPWAHVATALRYLKPRIEVDRGRLLDELFYSFGRREASRETVTRYINRKINVARRHWRRLPTEFIVVASTYSNGSSALQCRHVLTRALWLWFEGPAALDYLVLFDSRLRRSDISHLEHDLEQNIWHASIPVQESQINYKECQQFRIGKATVSIPAMTVRYC